ncbi:MAG: (d)CMP kinase [Bacilli bacterium]
MVNVVRIAIDGPAAAGKSTVAKRVAKQLGFVYIDTGAMYRALTWLALEKGISPSSHDALVHLLEDTRIELKGSGESQTVWVNGENVTDAVRTNEVTNNVSEVAAHAGVRSWMLTKQREMAETTSVVMDGRDIGTHVLPDAEVKIFLVASVATRAERRHKENVTRGIPSDLAQLAREIEARDAYDSTREVAPLVQAEDATRIDTSMLTIDEVTNEILAIANKLRL